LPGEAQKIDRVMNEFAKRYCANNPTFFSTPDTAYVLAYSLIMLNTDAHNPNVKKKMSLHDFIRNNRGMHWLFAKTDAIGIDNKRDLASEFLERLYFNIVNNEIKMKENDNVVQIQELCAQISGKLAVCALHSGLY
jgi:brefeldin A-inhibited guanine nucleotide-exchange protein